jgi:hypothetical protein
MQIDTEHLHHWMQAIRQSNNPMRTMDAFWSGQIKSKEWLINCLDEHVHFGSSIDIHGGWVGLLASMMFQSNIPVTCIRSVDIDPHCEHIATEMNRLEYNDGKFKAVTGDMINIRSDCDIIINTSTEHITHDEYELWLSGLPQNSLIVIQNNNYFECEEHINCKHDLQEFIHSSGLTVKFAGELKLAKYTRFMIIGTKN